jgi:hypothetical protein
MLHLLAFICYANVERLLSGNTNDGFVSGAAPRYSKKQTFAAYEICLPASGSYGRNGDGLEIGHTGLWRFSEMVVWFGPLECPLSILNKHR